MPRVCVSVCAYVHLLLSRLYHAEKLPKTNLVFIIADAKLTCSSCDATLMKQDEEPCILLPHTALIWQGNMCI